MVAGVLDNVSSVDTMDAIDCEVDKELEKFDTIVGDTNSVVVWSVWFPSITTVVVLYSCIDVDNNRSLPWLFHDAAEDCKDPDKEGITVDCSLVVVTDTVERETLLALADKDTETDWSVRSSDENMLDIMFTVLFSKSVAKPTEDVTTSKLALNELLISGVVAIIVSERFPVEMICVDNEMMSVDGKSVQVEALSIPVIKDSVE